MQRLKALLISKMNINNIDIQIYKFNSVAFLRTMYLLSPIMLLFYQENGLTVKELFLFQSAFYLVSILLEIPLGTFSDYINKKTALVISYTLFLFAMILWFCFHGYWIILAGEVIMAASKVILDISQSAYLYDYLKEKNSQDLMTKKYGILNFFLAAGTTIAAIIGTYLYAKQGSHFILGAEILITFICVVLTSSLKPVYKTSKQLTAFSKEIIKKNLFKVFLFIKTTYKNKSIMHYVYYSGFLTSFSIVFALSFQPLMLKAAVPIALFGCAAFCNHGVRALFSAITGKVSKYFSIRKMIIPLFILYITAFACIFTMLFIKNTVLIMLLILIVCLIIGVQLMFTIRHVSRLHGLVSSENRGTLISVNNLYSRAMTFVILFTSKVFMDKIGFENYYLILFAIFILLGTVILFKVYKIRDMV